MSVQAQSLQGLEDCNPSSTNHPTSCCLCRQQKLERPDSGHHGAKCEFCHAEHKRPKHRSQRGRHHLQRKEYQELREHMPAKLAEIIDLIYFVTNGEQQKVKKFMQYLKTVLEKFQEAVEVKVLAAVNNIGQQAQCLRPDNARVRRTCEPGVGEKRVDLASRYKWLSGTLHLLVRKLFESKEQSEVARLELIQKHVEICLHQLSEETKRLEQLAAQLGEALERVRQSLGEPDASANAWLAQRIFRGACEEIREGHFDLESLKELCADASRLLLDKILDERRTQMQEAVSLKDLLQLVQEELKEQSKDILPDEE